MLLAGSMPELVAIIATQGKANNSDYGDRRLTRNSLQKIMARKRSYSKPPRHPTNQWMRDALSHSDTANGYLTYEDVAALLNKTSLKQTYEKSIVQKMTMIRQVSLDEAKEISRITGFPLSESHSEEDDLAARFDRLSLDRRNRLMEILSDFEAAEEADQSKR